MNRPTIANGKAATQYFDAGAHSGAGMMHSEGLGGLSGLVAIEFNPQHTQQFNEKINKKIMECRSQCGHWRVNSRPSFTAAPALLRFTDRRTIVERVDDRGGR